MTQEEFNNLKMGEKIMAKKIKFLRMADLFDDKFNEIPWNSINGVNASKDEHGNIIYCVTYYDEEWCANRSFFGKTFHIIEKDEETPVFDEEKTLEELVELKNELLK